MLWRWAASLSTILADHPGARTTPTLSASTPASQRTDNPNRSIQQLSVRLSVLWTSHSRAPASSLWSSENAEQRRQLAMKSATHEIYHPDSLSQCLFQSWPRWSSRLIRCESEWEEDASETNGVCRTTSSSVILLVVSCLLQIFVRLASGDGWMRQRQRPDTPMMSHSSLPEPSPSPHTATQQRVMDYLSDMQHKLPPWFSIKGDSYKTEHILWLKYIYCSNPFLVYFQTAVSHFPCFFSSIIIISSLSFCGLVFAWSLLDDAFCICANNTSSWQKNKRQARKGETGGVSGIFFQAQPAYKSNPITPPWLCSIEGLNGVRRRRASSRAHIVGW